MTHKLKISKLALLTLLSGAIFTSCDKIKTVTPTTTEGGNFVKILKGGADTPIVKNPIDFLAVPKTLLAIDVRREVPNATELNKTVVVTVKDDTAAVKLKNPAYLQFPTAWYTISGDGVKTGGQGGTFTFTFKPGEFAKQVYITIPNATLLNPSALYGLGFTITSSDAGTQIINKALVMEIGAKNIYDGIYAVTGPMVDAANAALVQWAGQANPTPFSNAHGGAWALHLITSGAAQCLMFNEPDLYGDYFHPIYTGSATSAYGSFALVVNFNPANNTVSSVTNYYGQPASNSRSAQLDPSGANAVQGNRDILIKYFMLQPTVITTPPYIRTTFNEKWEYVGPR